MLNMHKEKREGIINLNNLNKLYKIAKKIKYNLCKIDKRKKW